MTKCTGVSIRNLFSALSLSLFTVVAIAQTSSVPVPAPAAPGTQSVPSIKVFTEEVVVDVVVTDRNGKPVQDLSGTHFKVLDDGRPQVARSFQEFGNVRVAQPVAAPLPAHVFTNVVAPGMQIAPVILLMDGLNTEIQDQTYMRKEILEYLKQIPAGTPVALFSMTPGLHLVVGLTTDMSVIKAGVANTSLLAQSALLDSGALTVEQQERNANGGTPADLMPNSESDPIMDEWINITEARRTASRTDHRVKDTLDSFEVLAKYLSRYPGRKSLIWFSASFPLYLTPATYGDESSTGDPTKTSLLMIGADYTFEVHHATDMLMASHVAVYPIDVRGVAVITVNNVQSRGIGNVSDQYIAFEEAQAAQRNSMTQIAKATGGEAFYNSNDLAGSLGKAVRDAATYYEISYAPDHRKLDERYHKIKVIVDQPGVQASYREGYYADDSSAHPAVLSSRANLLKLELEHGTAPAGQIQFFVRPLPVAPQPNLDDPAKRIGQFGPQIKGPVVRYGIDWLVNLSEVRATQLPNGNRTGKLTFAVVAYDSEAKVRNSLVHTIEFNLPPQRYQQLITGKGLPCFQELDLPKGSVGLRLALIDGSNGRTGSMEIPLDVK